MKDLPSTFLQACSGAKIKHIDMSYTSFESPGNLLSDGVTFMSKKGNERILWEEENRHYMALICMVINESFICLF
ncbi:hypothetical protein NAC89_17445 [Proteus mirabilis]|nr:hypothetical protein [Proteus mirabilis]